MQCCILWCLQKWHICLIISWLVAPLWLQFPVEQTERTCIFEMFYFNCWHCKGMWIDRRTTEAEHGKVRFPGWQVQTSSASECWLAPVTPQRYVGKDRRRGGEEKQWQTEMLSAVRWELWEIIMVNENKLPLCDVWQLTQVRAVLSPTLGKSWCWFGTYWKLHTPCHRETGGVRAHLSLL